MSLNDQFHSSLNHLLPQGDAYPRHPDAVLQLVLKGMAAGFSEAHEFVNETARQWFPQLTCTRLDEWEQTLILKNNPLTIDNIPERRKAVLNRWRQVSIPRFYTDSAVSSFESLKALFLLLGYDISLKWNYPMRVGDPVGTRLGSNAILFVTVQGYAGTPQPDFEAEFGRLSPGHYELYFIYP